MHRHTWVGLLIAVISLAAACRGPVIYPTPTAVQKTPPGQSSLSQASPEPTLVSTPTLTVTRTETFAYGFNVAWRGDEDGTAFNQRTAEMVRQAGFRWVRFQVRWEALEPRPGEWDFRPLDRVVPIYEEAGLSILASVVAAPEWARDPAG
ncbi:MAG: beta-galactosidase, partial [Thermomicrobium sp.]